MGEAGVDWYLAVLWVRRWRRTLFAVKILGQSLSVLFGGY
jgi:hypothetical protein